MTPTRRLVHLVLLIGALAVPAAAQTPTDPPSVLLIGGHTAFVDDRNIGHGVVGAGLEWLVSPRLAVGPEVLYMVGPGTDRDLLLLGTLRAGVLPFRRRVVPFVVGTAGLLRHSETWPDGTYSDVTYVVAGGGGVRIRASDRVFVAPEVVFGVPLHIRTTVTLGVRWGR